MARTMSDERERELRTVYIEGPYEDKTSHADTWAELDAERAAHEETKAALHERDRETVYVGSTARTITAMIERIVLAGEDAEEVVNDYGWEWKRGPDLSPLVALKARLALAEAVDTAAANFLAPQRMGCTLEELRAGVVQMAHTQPDPRAAADTLALIDALAAWRAGK